MDSSYLDDFIKECSQNGFPQLSVAPLREKLVCLYAYVNYFDADPSKLDELFQGIVYEEDSVDGIDGIFIDEESDNRDINVLCGICADPVTKKTDFLHLLPRFERAECHYNIALSKDKSGRNNLLNRVQNNDLALSPSREIYFRIITEDTPSPADKALLKKELIHFKPTHPNAEYKFVFGEDLESDLIQVENPKDYISSGELTLDQGSNALSFGQEGSLIVNISALSLQKLYQQYHLQGLLSQNLRYYVKNAKIDSRIVESIQSRADIFWYLNNGIILICDDYQIKDNQLFLTNFSIINGGQTTFLIGETPFEKDFYLQCKIIKASGREGEIKDEFISLVAEASNTQKPIRARDLIANRMEQKRLASQLKAVQVFCQIKRGQRVNKRLYPKAWQNTSNEELAQLLTAFLYQKPGRAKNQSYLLKTQKTYDQVFGKEYDSGLLLCLLHFKMYYKLWLRAQDPQKTDNRQLGLSKTGIYLTAACLGFLAKVNYYPSYIDGYNPEKWESRMEALSQCDIDHAFVDPESLDDRHFWFSLCDLCFQQMIVPGYQRQVDANPSLTDYGDFTKKENSYSGYIINPLMIAIKENKELFLSSLRPLFKARSLEEKAVDEKMLQDYYVPEEVVFENKKTLAPEITSAIAKRLQEYRSKTYKENNVPPYLIFTNKAKEAIATYGPLTLDELKDLRCMNRRQIKDNGDAILAIVKEETQKAD